MAIAEQIADKVLGKNPSKTNYHPLVNDALKAAVEIVQQDIEITESGEAKLQEGVAKDRRISLEDEEMRHGRKSKSQRFDGYKRHVLRDLDSGLLRAVGVTSANVPQSLVTAAIAQDLAVQKVELHIDRAYLSSSLVKDRDSELTIYCKAWLVKNGKRFAKTAFALDWEQGTICCPNQVILPLGSNSKVQFPAHVCASCPLQLSCTTSSRGRTVSIHPDEKLFGELRTIQLSHAGRAKLRERVAVEHSLSHISRWQGKQARYRGIRKNLFDLRRTAVVHNLHVILADQHQQIAS